MTENPADFTTYIEIIDVRTGDARKTGIGAIFNTPEETTQAFYNARALEKPGGHCFLLDLYIDDSLVDTIEIDAQGVTAIAGVEPKPAEEYVIYDRELWAKAQGIEVEMVA